MILKGGTAINFTVFNLPRLSVDIDMDYTPNDTFVSQYAYEHGIKEGLGLNRNVLPVKHCRDIGKKDMVYNNRIAKLEVDPETYTVKVDGEEITCEPAGELALAQRYFLF